MAPSVPELVHPVPAGEAGPWTRAMATTFLGDPDGADTRRHIKLLTRRWDAARTWGVRDRGRWVATLRTETRGVHFRTDFPAMDDEHWKLHIDWQTHRPAPTLTPVSQ